MICHYIYIFLIDQLIFFSAKHTLVNTFALVKNFCVKNIWIISTEQKQMWNSIVSYGNILLFWIWNRSKTDVEYKYSNVVYQFLCFETENKMCMKPKTKNKNAKCLVINDHHHHHNNNRKIIDVWQVAKPTAAIWGPKATSECAPVSQFAIKMQNLNHYFLHANVRWAYHSHHDRANGKDFNGKKDGKRHT